MSAGFGEDQTRSAVPELTLERYRLGELPAADASRVAVRLAGDGQLRQRLEALDRSDREFAHDGLSGPLAAGVKQRLHQPDGPRSLAALGWAVPAALAATLLVLLLRPGIWPPGAGDATDCCADRPKGTAASLMIYRNTPSGSETLADNDAARTGDVVRIGYRAADGGFGAIVSVDGRGVLTRHLPVDGDQAAPLEPARLVLLDRAFELDDAPTVERFYFITAPSRFEMPAVLDAVRRASSDIGRGVSQPLALPDGFTHVVFSLRKDSRP